MSFFMNLCNLMSRLQGCYLLAILKTYVCNAILFAIPCWCHLANRTEWAQNLYTSEDFQIPVEKMVATTVQTNIQQQQKKYAKVAILNSFCTVHVPIADAEWMKSICSMTTGVALLPGYGNQFRPTQVAVTRPAVRPFWGWIWGIPV